MAALGVVYGASASGKTFWVLDLVGAIARGAPWRGLPTRKGRVVYVVAEAAGGVAKRVSAYSRHHSVDDGDLPGFIDVAPVLVEDAEVLAREIDRYGGADIIVIDTLAQTIFGADENNSKDMGAAIGACRRLHDLTGAMVLLVHHTGKDQAKGARGHSSLRAATDVEIEISRDVASRVARITKMKDGEDFATFGFRLMQISIGTDGDDELITSCVIEHTEVTAEQVLRKPTGVWQIAVYEAAVELSESCPDGSPDKNIVAQAVATRAPFTGVVKTRRQSRFQAKRALDTLVEHGVLERRNGLCAPPPQASQKATDGDLSDIA